MNNIVTIIFNDKTELTAELNGNTYIVNNKPQFPRDLTNIKIVNNADGSTEIVEFGSIIDAASVDGRYWFGIHSISESQRAATQVRADVDYIAMELDIDL